ncbi:MAG: hypothetical protein ACLPGW_03995 [Roseiarcus sp.]
MSEVIFACIRFDAPEIECAQTLTAWKSSTGESTETPTWVNRHSPDERWLDFSPKSSPPNDRNPQRPSEKGAKRLILTTRPLRFC